MTAWRDANPESETALSPLERVRVRDAESVEHARRVLRSAREVCAALDAWCRVNVAMGVLMKCRNVSAADALELLHQAALSGQRQTCDIAEGVIRTCDRPTGAN